MNGQYWYHISNQLLANETLYIGVPYMDELKKHIKHLPKYTNYTVRRLETIECDYPFDDERYADNTFKSARWCLIIREG